MKSSKIASVLKTIGFVAITSTAVCGWLLGAVLTFQHLTLPAESARPPTVAATTNGLPTATSPEDQWRYTTQGWQNINHWSAQKSQASSLSIDHCHPLTLAALVVMVSALAMVLTSSDKEVDRLLKRAKR